MTDPQLMVLDPTELRVALFTGNYNYCADGVALVLNRLVAHLEKRGVLVRVVAPTKRTPAFPHVGTILSVPSLPFPLNSNYRVAWGIPRSVRQFLQAWQPHIVHIASPDGLGFAALRWAKRHRIPAVATYHTHYGGYMKYFGLGFLEPLTWKVMRRFYNRSTETYVPSASMREVLASHGFTCPMRVWEHGVDTHRFRPELRSLTWRRSQGIDDHELLVGYVGRIVWEKAVDVWADIILKLEESGRPIRSIMIGDGPAATILKRRLPRTIFTGYLPHDLLGQAVASMDVFLYPSLSETFGCVTLEALACGVPAIAADATGSRDLIRPGETGFLCPPNRVDAFAHRILELADDPELRQRMGRAAASYARHYTWDRVLEEMLQNYLRISQTSVGMTRNSLAKKGLAS
jgi:glycosyltransferase involved in cell wall biosynthesis